MSVRIADLLPKPVQVDTGNGMLEVRGLTLEQLVLLLMVHKNELVAYLNADGEPNLGDLLLKSPVMAAEIIAAAAGAEGQEDDIRKFPMSVQLTALAEIWTLSVPDVKKLTGVVQRLTREVREAQGQSPNLGNSLATTLQTQ